MNGDSAHVGFRYNDTDTFQPVVRMKKRRKQFGIALKTRTPVELLAGSMAELHSDSQWMAKCSHTVRDAISTLPAEINSILSLGLGSPVESAQARFQLCLLLELRDRILPSQVRIRAFDPVFSPEDILLLTSLGVQILPDNKEGKHELEGPTLAYMPHCDRELYENFLRANWRPGSLADLLLIGNDLRRYVESIPARTLGKESPCISRLAPLLASASLPEHRAFPNAFSSMAIQHVSSASLTKAQEESLAEGLWDVSEKDPISGGGHTRGGEGSGAE